MTARKVIPITRARTRAEDMSDAALLAACTTGDNVALGALFDRHADAVHRFLGRITSARQDELDDLVQSTFIEVCRAAHKYGGKSAVRTWILGIAANVSRHHARSEGRRRAVLVQYAELPLAAIERPDELAERRQMLERLERALDALPLPLRVAFVMCHLEGVPGAEAARVLDVREGTLAWRLHAARKAVQAALRGGSDGE